MEQYYKSLERFCWISRIKYNYDMNFSYDKKGYNYSMLLNNQENFKILEKLYKFIKNAVYMLHAITLLKHLVVYVHMIIIYGMVNMENFFA